MTDDRKPDLKVVRLFGEGTAADIVGSMRRMADSIAAESDDGTRTTAAVMVTVDEAGDMQVYGWGRVANKFTAAGMLMAAMHRELL